MVQLLPVKTSRRINFAARALVDSVRQHTETANVCPTVHPCLKIINKHQLLFILSKEINLPSLLDLTSFHRNGISSTGIGGFNDIIVIFFFGHGE